MTGCGRRVQAHAKLMMRSHVGQLDAMQAIAVVAAAMPTTTTDLDFLQVCGSARLGRPRPPLATHKLHKLTHKPWPGS